MITPAEKALANTCAYLAFHHGIAAVPSTNDRGERTLVLSRGAWCRAVVPEMVGEALAELRALETAEADA